MPFPKTREVPFFLKGRLFGSSSAYNGYEELLPPLSRTGQRPITIKRQLLAALLLLRPSSSKISPSMPESNRVQNDPTLATATQRMKK